MNFPKRELLLFLTVLAFPKLSRRGFESSSCFSTVSEPRLDVLPAIEDRYCRTSFVVSVLPAPLSPVATHGG
jgi:hypothetical protein